MYAKTWPISRMCVRRPLQRCKQKKVFLFNKKAAWEIIFPAAFFVMTVRFWQWIKSVGDALLALEGGAGEGEIMLFLYLSPHLPKGGESVNQPV